MQRRSWKIVLSYRRAAVKPVSPLYFAAFLIGCCTELYSTDRVPAQETRVLGAGGALSSAVLTPQAPRCSIITGPARSQHFGYSLCHGRRFRECVDLALPHDNHPPPLVLKLLHNPLIPFDIAGELFSPELCI